MKITLVGISGLLGLSLLAACGGGGGGGGTTTPPTSAPTLAPAAKFSIKWTQNGTRLSSAMFRKPMASGTANDTVVLIDAPLDVKDFSSDWISDVPDTATSAGVVNISPQPSSTPSWQINSTSANATFTAESQATATTAPSPNIFPYGVNDPGSGSVTATVDGTTSTTKYYKYGRISIACTTVDPAVYGTSSVVAQGGVQMVNGVPQPTNVPANADLYLSGPNCFGPYQNSAETEITVHCPYGCVVSPDPTQFMVIGSSVFTGSTPVTSLGVSAIYQPTFQTAGLLEFKDSHGNIYKTALGTQNVTNVPTTGPYCAFPCMDGSV